MVPLSPARARSSPVTRTGSPDSSTPCQWSTGMAGSQPNRALPSSASRTASSTAQSCARPSSCPDAASQYERPSRPPPISAPSSSNASTDSLPGAASASGTPPLRRFPSSHSSSRLVNSARAAGMGPVKVLASSASVRRCASAPSSGGMEPVRRFRRRCRNRSCSSCPSSGGTGPVRAFMPSTSSRSFPSAPSSEGIGPHSRLRCSRSERNSSSFPHSGEMRPLRPIRDRSTATTRGGVCALSVTPRQKPTGIESVQFSGDAPPSPINTVRAARRASQSASSSAGAADGRHIRVFPTASGTGGATGRGSPPVSAGAGSPASPKRLPPKLASDNRTRPSAGAGPLKRLFSSRSSVRFISRQNLLPNAAGTGPVRRFPSSRSTASSVKRFSSGGISPPSPLSGRCRETTRGGSPASRTPRHKPIGTSSRQLSTASPARVSRTASRMAQSRARSRWGTDEHRRSSPTSRLIFVRAGERGPEKSLPPKFKRSSASSPASAGGTAPCNPLSRNDNAVKFASCASSAGMAPVSALASSASSYKRDNRPSSGGMGPVSRLWSRRSDSSCSNPPRAGASRPRRPAPDNSSATTYSWSGSITTPVQSCIGVDSSQFSTAPPARTSRASNSALQSRIILPVRTADRQRGSPCRLRSTTGSNSGGIGPARRFPGSTSFVRLRSSPRAGGMGPVSGLPSRWTTSRASRRASSGGMRPFKPARDNRNPVTRSGSPPSSTPCQESRGSDSLQSRRASPARTSRRARSAVQSASSSGGVLDVGRQSRSRWRSWSGTAWSGAG